MWKYIALLAAAVGVMVSIKMCSHPAPSPVKPLLQPRSAFSQSGGDTIDIAIEISPLCYSLAGDTISGLDYDLLQYLSAKEQLPIKFHAFVPLAAALDALERGDVDMVVASLASTSELKSRFLLTDEVYTDRQVLVQPRDSAFTSQIDLGGQSVWIASASPTISRIKNLGEEIGEEIKICTDSVHSPEQLVVMTALGRIPRAVVGSGTARRLSAQYPQLDTSLGVSFDQFQAWAIRQGDEQLLNRINAALDSVKTSPYYDKLIEHYLP